VIALARRALAIAPLTHQTQLIAKVGSQSRKSRFTYILNHQA
jgi:hypothetical protein